MIANHPFARGRPRPYLIAPREWSSAPIGLPEELYVPKIVGLGEGGVIGGMRVKTSVTIDERVLRAIDKTTTRTRSRSRVIEDAAREFLARRARAIRESRDLAILDESADALNREMEDVLAYQADV
jgi:hypothetical protein